MPLEVWIAGLPSERNGAATELDNLIDLFRDYDVAVNLVPLKHPVDPAALDALAARRCRVHLLRPDLFRDKILLSFAQQPFLERLPEIAATGRPARVIWFNCGVRASDAELAAHAAGLIDLHGFVSAYQRRLLEPALATRRPVESFDYRPYLNLARIDCRYREWDGTYVLGRISRDDPTKYPRDTWRLFDRVHVPPGMSKQVNFLGFGRRARARIGPPPPHLVGRMWRPYEIEAASFYRTIDTLLYKVGAPESYGRVIVEACAHGAVPVAQDDFAFPELIVPGVTGFLGGSTEEMAEQAGYLAHHPERHRTMARRARAHVEALVDPARCWAGWAKVLAG